MINRNEESTQGKDNKKNKNKTTNIIIKTDIEWILLWFLFPASDRCHFQLLLFAQNYLFWFHCAFYNVFVLFSVFSIAHITQLTHSLSLLLTLSLSQRYLSFVIRFICQLAGRANTQFKFTDPNKHPHILKNTKSKIVQIDLVAHFAVSKINFGCDIILVLLFSKTTE